MVGGKSEARIGANATNFLHRLLRELARLRHSQCRALTKISRTYDPLKFKHRSCSRIGSMLLVACRGRDEPIIRQRPLGPSELSAQ